MAAVLWRGLATAFWQDRSSPSNSCLSERGFYRLFLLSRCRVRYNVKHHPLRNVQRLFLTIKKKNTVVPSCLTSNTLITHPDAMNYLWCFRKFTWWCLCYFCSSSIKIFTGTGLRFKLEGTRSLYKTNSILRLSLCRIRVV